MAERCFTAKQYEVSIHHRWRRGGPRAMAGKGVSGGEVGGGGGGGGRGGQWRCRGAGKLKISVTNTKKILRREFTDIATTKKAT